MASRPAPRSRLGTCLFATLVLLGAARCKNEHESLVLAQLSASDQPADSPLTSVTVVIQSPEGAVTSRTFSTPDGISASATNPTVLGVWVPEDVTGAVTINATARPDVGCQYAGLNSAGSAIIQAAGDTVAAAVHLRATTVCGGTDGGGGMGGGGAKTGGAGMGGTTGTAGSGGIGGGPSCGTSVGTAPAPVAPPTLTSCTEYDHNPAGAVCDQDNHLYDPFIFNVATSPDGQLLVTAGANPSDPSSDSDVIRIWRLSGATPTSCGPTITNPGMGPAYVAFSPNGRYLAIGWRQAYVDIYSVPSFAKVATAESSVGPIYGVAFTPDSQQIVTLDWDNGTDGHLYLDRVDGSAVSSTTSLGVDPDALAVSPVSGTSGARVAVAGYDGTLAVYSLSASGFGSPTFLTSSTAGDPVWAVQFSPDGKLLVAGTDTGLVQFWNVPITSAQPSGTTISLPGGMQVSGVVFHPSGMYVGVAFDHEFDIYSVSTRALVSRDVIPTYMDSLTFSASGGALIGGEDRCGKFVICGN